MKTSKLIRKAHRYLGLFIGVQFLFWTISGLYFSWTNIDQIHGDFFKKKPIEKSFENLIGIEKFKPDLAIKSLKLIQILDKPYYWVNDSLLINAQSGEARAGITATEAKEIARRNVLDEYQILSVKLITETNMHHEYREKKLPAYVINFEGNEDINAFVSQADGTFQTLRHRNWRWFDFLWMTHTMDYESRDNINNWLLRIFSTLGLITVMSGFLLWFYTSSWFRKKR
ncbi:PepSY domain-containing protein [Lacihabitans lacunae]|uniref:PepSY domain-containing protein n=1 Tax=Lacihabitans lacunae TaxID=1028214 RepID=A0ABV7Z150_9BACT